MVSSPLDKVCRLRRCFTYGLASPEQLSSLLDSAPVVHLYQFSAGRLVYRPNQRRLSREIDGHCEYLTRRNPDLIPASADQLINAGAVDVFPEACPSNR
ncbi:hypothetical protein HYQ46_010961 [Verticillium longisporum]|nr:hypothetical protein HYQ46_010961 [Verticillium longisporum]